MIQPLKELIGFSKWNAATKTFGEIIVFRIPEGNVFGGLGDGWYRMYLDGKPLCMVHVIKPVTVTIRLFDDVPRTVYTDMVEEPIDWENLDAGSVIRLVTACNKGERAIPYWKVGSLPSVITGYVGTPKKEKVKKKKEASLDGATDAYDQ